ncbi:hypothetical protein MASR1M8_12510 [Thermomonas brevis]
MCRYMDANASASGSRRWVEKTPGNIFSFLELSSLAPDAKLIAIVRDARAVMSSLLKRGYDPVIAVARWYLSNLHVYPWLGDSRVLILRYEDLVTVPERTCAELFRFIGEDPEEDILTGGSAGKVIPSWSASPADPISQVGLWQEGRSLPASLVGAFRSVRPVPSCIEGSALPTPIELQEALGYVTSGLDKVVESTAQIHMGLMKERMRYRLAMMRYGIWPQKQAFTLTSMK